MSQFPGGEPIGRARIDFTGDTTDIRASASEAAAVTQDAATSAQQSYEKVGDAAEDAGSKTEAAGNRASRPWRYLITTAAGVVGGFVAIARSVTSVISLLETGEVKAAKFMESLWSGDASESVQKIEDRMAKLETVLSGIGNPLEDFGDIIRSITGDAQRELEALGQAKKILEQKSGTDDVRAGIDKEVKIAAAAERIREQLFQATLDDAQKIQFAEIKRLQEISALRRDATTEETRHALDEAERLVKEISIKEQQANAQTLALKRLAERQADEERRQELERQARIFADAISRELGRIQQQANNLFSGSQLTAQLQEIARIMQQVARNTRNLGD